MQNTHNSEKSESYIAKVNYFYTVIIDASILDYMRIPVSLGLRIPLSPGPLPFQIVAFLVSFVPSSSSFPLNVSVPQASAFTPLASFPYRLSLSVISSPTASVVIHNLVTS